MSFKKAIELLQEFDYEVNGLEDTIFFLQTILDELKKRYNRK